MVTIDQVKNAAAAVKERTKGAVTFTVYGGGIAGDELDVLRAWGELSEAEARALDERDVNTEPMSTETG